MALFFGMPYKNCEHICDYYGAAEPPVWREPLVRPNGTTGWLLIILISSDLMVWDFEFANRIVPEMLC